VISSLGGLLSQYDGLLIQERQQWGSICGFANYTGASPYYGQLNVYDDVLSG